MSLRNTLLILQRIKPRTVVTVQATDTHHYTQATSSQTDTSGHCSRLYMCFQTQHSAIKHTAMNDVTVTLTILCG